MSNCESTPIIGQMFGVHNLQVLAFASQFTRKGNILRRKIRDVKFGFQRLEIGGMSRRVFKKISYNYPDSLFNG